MSKQNVGQACFLRDPLLRVRPRCSPEPVYAVDVPGGDARHRLCPGVGLHLEGRQADASQVLGTSEKRIQICQAIRHHPKWTHFSRLLTR